MPTKILLYSLQNDLEKVSTIGLPTVSSLDGLPARQINNTVVVRWGKSMIPNGYERDFKYVINPSNAIRLNVQKKRAQEVMIRRGVRTPRLFDKVVPKGVVAVMRPMEHEEGNGYTICRGEMHVPPGHYATEFIKTDTEVRVWFARTGRAHMDTLMAYRVPMKGQREGHFPCRASFGYDDFQGAPRHLHDQVLKAANAIGLDCGAADILIVGNKGVILELNSSPSVDFRHIRTFYREALPRVIRAKYPALKLDLDPQDE